VPATCGERHYLYKALELSLSAILTIARPIMTAHFRYINGLKPLLVIVQCLTAACLAPNFLAFLFQESAPCSLFDNLFVDVLPSYIGYKNEFTFLYQRYVYLLIHSMQQNLLVKLTGLQLVKKFPAFSITRKFITAFTIARHLSLS
jgi:hypothetical protein